MKSNAKTTQYTGAKKPITDLRERLEVQIGVADVDPAGAARVLRLLPVVVDDGDVEFPLDDAQIARVARDRYAGELPARVVGLDDRIVERPVDAAGVGGDPLQMPGEARNFADDLAARSGGHERQYKRQRDGEFRHGDWLTCRRRAP